MFIEKLTTEQICDFFKTKHLSHFISKSMYEEANHLYVSIDGDSMSINCRLYDFEGSTVANEDKWRNFLYGIFGEVYKQEYEKFLKSEIEYKLSCLDEFL